MPDSPWYDRANADLNAIGYHATGDDSLSVPTNYGGIYDLWSDLRPSIPVIKHAQRIIELCKSIPLDTAGMPISAVVHPGRSSEESPDLDVMAICLYGRPFKDPEPAGWHYSAEGDLKVEATGEVFVRMYHKFVFGSDGSRWTPEILEWSVESDEASIRAAFLKICSYIADAEALCRQNAVN